MKKLLVLGWLLLVCRGFSADGVQVFQDGLRAFRDNGADALLNTWYDAREDSEKIAAIRARLLTISRNLGPVIDTEVFRPRNLGKNLQRLHGVIYFEKRPLWFRSEYYSINGRSGFISLEFSLSADDILPLTWATPN